MATTLEEIIEDHIEELRKLKTNQEDLEKAQSELDQNPGDDQKEKSRDDAKSKYDDTLKDLIDSIEPQINEQKEVDTLANYSKEVQKRRESRSKESLKSDIQKTQGDIDVMTIEIAEIDKTIAEKRQGLSEKPDNP